MHDLDLKDKEIESSGCTSTCLSKKVKTLIKDKNKKKIKYYQIDMNHSKTILRKITKVFIRFTKNSSSVAVESFKLN